MNRTIPNKLTQLSRGTKSNRQNSTSEVMNSFNFLLHEKFINRLDSVLPTHLANTLEKRASGTE